MVRFKEEYGNGAIKTKKITFPVKKGQQVVLSTNAPRYGSDLYIYKMS